MPSWQGKSTGTRTGYGIFVFLLQKCGIRAAYGLLRVVAGYYLLFSRRSSRILRLYFRERIGLAGPRVAGSVYRNYYLFGQSLIDRVVLMAGIPNRLTYNFDGEDNLRRMVAEGQGGLLLSAHIGNWEIAGHLLERLDTVIHIVMYDAEHQKIKDYLEGVTGKRKAHIIVIKDDLSHIYAISEALRQNELVCMHADRFVEGTRTLTADLLGAPARFPVGPFVLAKTYKAPVSFVFALKESSRHYHFFASEPRRYETVEPALVDFVHAMEEKVKKYPEQWFNYYNFWHL